MKIAARVRAWLPVAGWSGLIFFLSHQSLSAPQFNVFFSLDKLAHLGVYGIWGFLFARAVDKAGPPSWRARTAFVVAAAALLYGISDEFHQAFIPHRTPSAADVAMDVLGAFAGQWVYRRWNRPRCNQIR
ncbi:MAG: VanZ family protein [Candidatus Omnitrophica bacterium]|nr:VanZ family protein [Candidatus Omnitrophota bacterium]